ncbi:MAG: metal-sulfur cluster assembly factor [Candidatus Paceibacterota bacterium]
MITKNDIISICQTIEDPEVHLDIYTLGLIYNIEITNNNEIKILMTYTTPLCPFGGKMQEELRMALSILNPKDVNIELTFSPPWKVSNELREALGI